MGYGIHEQTGSSKDIIVCTKKRACKHCGKTLSQYNPNDYCFVHVGMKIKLEQAEDQEKRRKQKEAVNAKYEKKKRERSCE